MTFIDKFFAFAMIFVVTGLFVLWIKDTSPSWPKILMMCSAPWEWCVPYEAPTPFSWYNTGE